MEWTTHALSGLVLGYMVTNDWKGAAVGGVAGVIPDLDEPRSKFGKIFFFLSIPLNQIFGHRTFTHSLLFAVLIGLIVHLFSSPLIAIASVSGILAHIIGDMLTGRVKLLYPLKTSIGIQISRAGYIVMDRVTRLVLTLVIGIAVWNYITQII